MELHHIEYSETTTRHWRRCKIPACKKFRKCSNCKQVLFSLEFHKSSKSRRGLLGRESRCRRCTSEIRAGREVGKYRRRTKNYRPTEKANKAHKALETAVRRGQIIKPPACEECRKPFDKRRISGHHHKGYDFPLVVQFLCHLCHARSHAF